MTKKSLSAALLVLMLLLGSAAPVCSQQADVQAGKEKITPEEEREALQLAGQFVKGFEEKNNLLALIDELYVKDFDARLRPSFSDYSYIASVKAEVLERANGEDLRRFYVAVLDFTYAGGFLYGVNQYNRKLKGDEPRDNDPAISELMPPNVIEVFKTDPILAEIIAEGEEEERRKNSEQSDETQQRADAGSEDRIRAISNEIKSVESLRHYVSTLEKANALIRAHLKTLQAPQTWAELISALEQPEEKRESSDNDTCEGMCPRVTILSEDFFGCPKGTRLICLKVMLFHVDLVRVDGKLRILTAYISD
ncbi:MAG TPA: hypothetical protein VGC66_17315 [Pyrinomonadaceae bacterium]|jgi:hypothetical protein